MKIILVVLLMLNVTYAQIGGISGTKLLVPNAATLSKGQFDFEPAFSIFSANNHFDNTGKLNDLQRSELSSAISFRVTMGLADNLELGTSFTTCLEDIYIGSKFTAFNNNKILLALIVGGSLPGGNYSSKDSAIINNLKYSYSAGFIASYSLTQRFSFDGIFTFSKITGSIEFDKIINYGISVGYFLTKEFQAVMELNEFASFNGSFNSIKLSVTPGFSFQFSQYLLLVFGIQKDIWGKNELNGTNYITAFTMTF